MSNLGKVCISICAKTFDELAEQIRQVESVADVIEVRFDHLAPPEVWLALERLHSTKPILITYRSRSQGGSVPDESTSRFEFWKRAAAKIRGKTERFLVDNEQDLHPTLKWEPDRTVINSFHDLDGVPDDLAVIHASLSDGGIAKIAVSPATITKSIPVWKLLEDPLRRPFVPVAMGEVGKWTRILGLAHGAFMTYGSPAAGFEAAPGQIAAADLVNVFRVKELDRRTEVFGVIAGDSSYSVSPWMHNAGFKALGMNRVFVPLQVDDLDEFIRRMVREGTREIELNFKGFSVTNPHKQSIMRYMDRIDDSARKIGAVNTVHVEGGEFIGSNTDAMGFITPLKAVIGDLKGSRVSLVGAGGAARACIYALRNEGASVLLHARSVHTASTLAEEFDIAVKGIPAPGSKYEADIVVNATPLGTKGSNEGRTIATADQLTGVRLVYDLVYNPIETRLGREAKEAGAAFLGGLEMVLAQGKGQFEIWTGHIAPITQMTEAVKLKLAL